MSRYDGLIIPRSYSEYINKTDAATLLQALQQSGVLSNEVNANDNRAIKSSAVNTVILNHFIDDIEISNISQLSINSMGTYRTISNVANDTRPLPQSNLWNYVLFGVSTRRTIIVSAPGLSNNSVYINVYNGTEWGTWRQI